MIRINTRFVAALAAVVSMFAGPLTAAEITSQVIAVKPDGEVQLRLQPDSSVAPGDEVRIEAEVPGVGMLAIQTRWQVVQVDPGQTLAVARPQGSVTGTPQVGYTAIITTAQSSGIDPQPDPDVTPYERITYETQPCDLVGGSPDDPDLAGIAPGVEYSEINGDTVIRECLVAVENWPDTPRFYTNLTRGYFKAGRDGERKRAGNSVSGCPLYERELRSAGSSSGTESV